MSLFTQDTFSLSILHSFMFYLMDVSTLREGTLYEPSFSVLLLCLFLLSVLSTFLLFSPPTFFCPSLCAGNLGRLHQTADGANDKL